MRNLFTPVIGFVIGSGFYLSTKVLADTQSGKMPGPKSFGYFIAAITAASVAGVAMLGKERNYYSEEGSAPIQDPMEFGEMANWTPLDGSEGLKRKRAEVRMPQPASGTWSPAPMRSPMISNNSGIGKIGTDTPSATIPVRGSEPAWVKPVATALGFALGFFGIHEIKKVL